MKIENLTSQDLLELQVGAEYRFTLPDLAKCLSVRSKLSRLKMLGKITDFTSNIIREEKIIAITIY